MMLTDVTVPSGNFPTPNQVCQTLAAGLKKAANQSIRSILLASLKHSAHVPHTQEVSPLHAHREENVTDRRQIDTEGERER